jgi:hypothetical protein
MLVEDKSAHWGEELHKAGWRARLIRGAYQHACHICAPDLVAEADGMKARAA